MSLIFFSDNTLAHSDLTHVHTCFTAHIGISQTDSDGKCAYSDHDALSDVHGIIQLYAHSFRYCHPCPVGTANQSTLEIKGIRFFWPLPFSFFSINMFLLIFERGRR